MKTKLLLLVMTMLMALPSFAQKTSDDKEKETKRKEMLEFKLKYISDEMDLRGEQRKQFEEVYTEMENERRAVYKRIKAAEKSVESKNATEADYEKASAEISEARAEMVTIEKKYDARFATFLSKKQIFKMKEAEGKFWQKIQGCREKKRHGTTDKKKKK